MPLPEPGEVWSARVYYQRFRDSGRPKSMAVQDQDFKNRYCIILRRWHDGSCLALASSGRTPGEVPAGFTLIYDADPEVTRGLGIRSRAYWYGERVEVVEPDDFLREERDGLVPEPAMEARVRPGYDAYKAKQARLRQRRPERS